MQRSVLGAGALIWLSTISAYAATLHQLYQTWDKNNQREPEIAEKAAEDYLHAAPQGPHAHDLQVWLDAYHKALAALRLAETQVDRSNAWSKKQAVGQPAQPQQPTVQTAQAAAKPPKLAAVPAQPAAQPRPTRQASASTQENSAQKKQPSEVPQLSSAGVKPASQSLAETLAFIADKVASQGRINFTAQFHNPADNHGLVEQLSYEASDATIDPNRCQVSFHWHIEQDGNGSPDQDRSVQLRLAKNIRVETIDQALGDLNATAGHPFSVRVHPEAYVVHIARWDSPSGDNLYFHDRDMAERIGEATKHALKLCSDGAGEPFRHP